MTVWADHGIDVSCSKDITLVGIFKGVLWQMWQKVLYNGRMSQSKLVAECGFHMHRNGLRASQIVYKTK